jgi:hypothetical protein
MKDVLIVGSRKPTLPENSVKIQDILYWNALTQLFQEHEEHSWYELSYVELDVMWLGIKEISFETDSRDRVFEVIDKQKYIWAKLKYGI